MDMGIGAVYGDEDEGMPDADIPCNSMLGQCKARCCGVVFALTRQEAEQGIVEYNRDKPFSSLDMKMACVLISTANNCSVKSGTIVRYAVVAMIAEMIRQSGRMDTRNGFIRIAHRTRLYRMPATSMIRFRFQAPENVR